MDFDINMQIQSLTQFLILWAPKLIGAILFLLIGFWVVGRITDFLSKSMDKAKLDRDVQPFLKSMASVLLKVLVVLSAAGIIGVEITAFAALLAAAGLAIGMALQGTLGHFASGVLILIFKPYRIGDLVNLQDQVGHVLEIQVFNTIIRTLDNKKVIIPNGIATSGIMTNLSSEGKLRVDLNVAMPYEEDFDKIQTIIQGALDRVTERLPDTPTIAIEKMGENNIVLAVRPYATPEKYWDVYFKSYQYIKEAYGKAGIKVAYPTRIIKQE